MSNPRREFIRKVGITGSSLALFPVAFKVNATLPGQDNKPEIGQCLMTPEEIPGPYLRNDKLMRRNITEREDGIPLLLSMRVIDARTCKSLDNILIDIWHCNSVGKYSGWEYVNPDIEAPDGSIGSIPRTDNSTFLRGAQKTDCDGFIRFTTIYPGFYAGRAIHIHTTARKANIDKKQDERFYFVGQLYFSEEISREVMKEDQYSPREIKRLTNEEDEIFSGLNNGAAVIETHYIGDKITDGIYGQVIIAIDTSIETKQIKRGDLFKNTV